MPGRLEAVKPRFAGGDGVTLRPRRASPAIGLVIWAVAALTALGGYVAVGVVDRATSTPPPARVGEAVPTSFGALSVLGVERLTAHGHGPANVLPPGTFQLQLTVTLSNALPRLVHTAADSVRVAGVAPARSTLPRALRPGASVTGRVSFLVPARSDELRLTYPDPDGGQPLTVDLGRGGHGHQGRTR